MYPTEERNIYKVHEEEGGMGSKWNVDYVVNMRTSKPVDNFFRSLFEPEDMPGSKVSTDLENSLHLLSCIGN